MKLVKVQRENTNSEVALAYDFRLYDDQGEPFRFAKSVSFKVDPSEDPCVIMVIERYVLNTDEIDLDLVDGERLNEGVASILIEDVPTGDTNE